MRRVLVVMRRDQVRRLQWPTKLALPLLVPVLLTFAIESDWPRGLSPLINGMAILIGWPIIDRLFGSAGEDEP